MPKPFSKAKREEWKEKILQQSSSGLSVSKWCEQHNIAVHTFHYWRKTLFPVPILKRSTFTELSDQHQEIQISKNTGITLEYSGFRIELEQCFDSVTLKQCLQIIKEAVC